MSYADLLDAIVHQHQGTLPQSLADQIDTQLRGVIKGRLVRIESDERQEQRETLRIARETIREMIEGDE